MKPIKDLDHSELMSLWIMSKREAALRVVKGGREDKLFAQLYETIADLIFRIIAGGDTELLPPPDLPENTPKGTNSG